MAKFDINDDGLVVIVGSFVRCRNAAALGAIADEAPV
jgi:hypothetical protein